MFVTVDPFHLFPSVFPLEMVTETAPSLCENSDIDICSDRNLLDLEYASGVVQLNKDPSKLQVFLNRPNDNTGMVGMRFAPPKYRTLL